MTDLDQFKKLGVSDLAAKLAIHPFNVVRILTTSGKLPADLSFDEDDIDMVRELGGIEYWWTAKCTIEQDAIRARGILRSIARELVRRGIHGEKTTRADNVYRGLKPDDERLARRTLNVLIQEHYVRTVPTSLGIHVNIAADQVSTMKRLATAAEVPPALAVLWLA